MMINDIDNDDDNDNDDTERIHSFDRNYDYWDPFTKNQF